ncbi:spectrin beta chain, non-erythrocytic 1 [Trichonephila clavipes]|nr:spectrin beta chain, non-erythrocytic 1 [Trichonephila clavipes]
MEALITSSELPQDVATCETSLAQHEVYKSEIDARFRSFYAFEARGKEIIANGHFLSQDVQAKIDALNSSLNDLLNTWNTRKDIYEQTLDLQLFKNKLMELETWLNTQEHNLSGDDGRSKKLQNWKKMLYKKWKKKKRKKLEDERKLEQQKLEEIRRREEERLLEERKMERLQSDVTQNEESDDDYRSRNESSSGFRRMGSRMSYRNKTYSLQEQPDVARPDTPIIPGKISRMKEKRPPPTRAEGFLARKQERESGGKRSTSRQWKTLYTVLCGQLLCFFKDKKAFLDSHSAKPPVNILKASCYIPRDYHKRKYVFRLELSDNSAFLFEAQNDIKRDEWMQKINFTASLLPKEQLLSPNEVVQSESIAKGKKHNEVEEEALYSTVGDKSFESSTESYKFSEEADSHHDRTFSETYESYKFPEDLDDFKGRSSEAYGSSFKTSFPEKRDSIDTRTMEDIYGDPFRYEDPFEDTGRSFSITSFDENPQSARSSLSNQSSYVTAAASNSSISTLQDERVKELESSEDEYAYASTTPRGSYAVPNPTPRGSYAVPNPTPRGSYAVPNPTPRGSYAEESVTPRGSFSEVDTKKHDQLRKHQSLSLPIREEELFKKVKKSEPKKRWGVFSLRRK